MPHPLLNSLNVGDVIFYSERDPDTDWHANLWGHCALVTHIDQNVRISHVIHSGLIISTLRILKSKIGERVITPFRLSAQSYAIQAATSISHWVCNNDHCVSAVGSTFGDSVKLVPEAYNQFGAYTAPFHSSSYGRKARAYAAYLYDKCQQSPPKELNMSRGGPFWHTGTFCSALIISAFQAAIGATLSEHYMALDARHTGSKMFRKYLKNNTEWTQLSKIHSA